MSNEKKNSVVTLKVPSVFNYGTGRRKSAIAKVWLFEGKGIVEVNQMPAFGFLKNEVLVKRVNTPLQLLGLDKKYDVVARTLGGGLVGQADAIALGITRALVQLNEEFRTVLKENGLMTRDPRVKERKKYGRKKARKGYQFRKR